MLADLEPPGVRPHIAGGVPIREHALPRLRLARVDEPEFLPRRLVPNGALRVAECRRGLFAEADWLAVGPEGERGSGLVAVVCEYRPGADGVDDRDGHVLQFGLGLD